MSNRIFAFDVDGTLTPSRSSIDAEFGKWFEKFAQTYPVYLVTGSDHPKTLEQLGKPIMNLVQRSYQCSGNDVWIRGETIRSNDWKLPYSAHAWLENVLEESLFPLRTGTHIEQRPGMVNFSIVGRGADTEQRQRYAEYDQAIGERLNIADLFNLRFAELGIVANVAGDTGMDIQPRGADKSQIIPELKQLHPDAEIYFYGDKTAPGGNDHTIATALLSQGHSVFPVNNWQDTFTLLKQTVEI
jgi:phosphomannomutase